MTAASVKNQEIENELKIISQKLRFLVKICKEADNDTENRFCVELVGRELSAYAGNVDEMIQGVRKPLGQQPAKPPAKPPSMPLSAPPLVGAKALNPEPPRKPLASSPLDFPIDD
jgi:hypothetical protein